MIYNYDNFVLLIFQLLDEKVENLFPRFENEVFILRPYYFDCLCKPTGNEGDGEVECTCEAGKPNFVYKKIGFEGSFYKHPGRGTAYNYHLSHEQFCQMVADCLESVKNL